MSTQESDKRMWTEIAKRMAAGEKQTVLARELGMKLGKFRYRFRKFLEQQERVDLALNHPEESQSTKPNKAWARVAVEITSPTGEDKMHELYDESWHRTWNVSRLALLVQGPMSLHAYWEVDEQKKHLVQRHFQRDWANLPFYLRIYDVTDLYFDGTNANYTQEIRVRPEDDNWYISNVRPRRNYIADFGTTTLPGNFFSILRSNVVLTPPEPTFELNETPRFVPRLKPKVNSLILQEVVQVETTGCDFPSTFERPYPNEFDGYSGRTRR